MAGEYGMEWDGIRVIYSWTSSLFEIFNAQ
jgi:hypothetical protein